MTEWFAQRLAEICTGGDAVRLVRGAKWWHWVTLARDLETVAAQLVRPLLVLVDGEDIVVGAAVDLTCADCGRVHRSPVCARACCTAQGDACECEPRYLVVAPAGRAE